jgi:hypothetical protein
MATVTVLTAEGATEIDGTVDGGRVLTSPEGIRAALGWELKPEGLCRDDRCVLVPPDVGGRDGGPLDLVAIAGLLGSSSLVDESHGVIAVGVPSSDRRQALTGRIAPDFSLPDLEGTVHTLEQFKDRKRLLVAFASW